jgi:hypothetical protein
MRARARSLGLNDVDLPENVRSAIDAELAQSYAETEPPRPSRSARGGAGARRREKSPARGAGPVGGPNLNGGGGDGDRGPQSGAANSLTVSRTGPLCVLFADAISAD